MSPEQFQAIVAHLGKIEDKLDDHLERIAKVESQIGSIKWALGLTLSSIGSFLVFFLDKFIKGV